MLSLQNLSQGLSLSLASFFSIGCVRFPVFSDRSRPLSLSLFCFGYCDSFPEFIMRAQSSVASDQQQCCEGRIKGPPRLWIPSFFFFRGDPLQECSRLVVVVVVTKANSDRPLTLSERDSREHCRNTVACRCLTPVCAGCELIHPLPSHSLTFGSRY